MVHFQVSQRANTMVTFIWGTSRRLRTFQEFSFYTTSWHPCCSQQNMVKLEEIYLSDKWCLPHGRKKNGKEEG